MVYLDTSEEWQKQSALLLQARPTTTRITTKYNIPDLDSTKYQKQKKRKRQTDDSEKGDAAAPKVPRAVLVLKTFDPESGACLKFKTDRAPDVGRLINGLGRMGRHMAAMPQKPEVADAPMKDAPSETPAKDQPSAASAPQPTADNNASGGKKKKKGKK